jgi:hypothetical protein
MPKKSESSNHPEETPAKETAPAGDSRGSRKASRNPAASEEPREAAPAPDEAASAAPAAQQTSATPAAAENTQATPAPLAGLRGADYVKALSSHRLATIEVPLLPNERRGDWERARGQKIRVTTRQVNVQEGNGSSLWRERDHALAALVIELERPGATRFDQIDLRGRPAREAIERLSDYTNQARLRAQAQTGKKWTASQVYLVPIEDA